MDEKTFTGLIPFNTGGQFVPVKIYDFNCVYPPVDYGFGPGWFPIAYGVPGGNPEDPTFTPELCDQLAASFEAAEHANGMPEPLGIDNNHNPPLGGADNSYKGFITGLRSVPETPEGMLKLQTSDKQPATVQPLPEGSNWLVGKIAVNKEALEGTFLHGFIGIKPSIFITADAEDKPWISRSVGLCQVQNFKALPAFYVDIEAWKNQDSEPVIEKKEEKEVLEMDPALSEALISALIGKLGEAYADAIKAFVGALDDTAGKLLAGLIGATAEKANSADKPLTAEQIIDLVKKTMAEGNTTITEKAITESVEKGIEKGLAEGTKQLAKAFNIQEPNLGSQTQKDNLKPTSLDQIPAAGMFKRQPFGGKEQ